MTLRKKLTGAGESPTACDISAKPASSEVILLSTGVSFSTDYALLNLQRHKPDHKPNQKLERNDEPDFFKHLWPMMEQRYCWKMKNQKDHASNSWQRVCEHPRGTLNSAAPGNRL